MKDVLPQVNNHGCYGGDQGRAFDWVFQHGGLARNEDYPYRGVNDFCKKDVDEIKFKGGLRRGFAQGIYPTGA